MENRIEVTLRYSKPNNAAEGKAKEFIQPEALETLETEEDCYCKCEFCSVVTRRQFDWGSMKDNKQQTVANNLYISNCFCKIDIGISEGWQIYKATTKNWLDITLVSW